ncbi:hypothetical protein L218DRAFT_1076019 [Marasmius fiardii PR-910]|nr:hypothetical protein L218DRAFT_1076019 [Marasmius fiardii PR-910]
MSHCSTTATSTYTLQKYSRSYPNPGQTTSNEWQHFTNPLIRLILDVQKSAANKLESVRLRIIWSIEGGTGPNSANEVVFEDLDLLSFSSVPFRNRLERNRSQQTEGLPLKAVYRDTIAGIRYLHPLDGSSYRRFQVTFSSLAAVSEFIQSIETICPCKANNNVNTTTATPSNNNSNSTTMPVAVVQSQTEAQAVTPGSLAVPKSPGGTSHSHTLATAPPDSSTLNPMQFHPCTLPRAGIMAQSMLPSKPPFFLPPNIPQSSSGLPAFLTPTPSFHPAYRPQVLFPHTQSHLPPRPHGHFIPEQGMLALPWSSIPPPPSSNPSSVPPSELASSQTLGSNSGTNPPSENASQTLGSTPTPSQIPPPPSSASGPSTTSPLTDPLLASLRETTRLYDLAPNQLEALVAEVIREDGFVPLMERLDSMWRVKGYLGYLGLGR